jgi:hypothetical protein
MPCLATAHRTELRGREKQPELLKRTRPIYFGDLVAREARTAGAADARGQRLGGDAFLRTLVAQTALRVGLSISEHGKGPLVYRPDSSYSR